MTTNDVFSDRLALWLHEDAERRVPDHIDEVLVVTASTRQRPWWASPERWLPVDITSGANAFAPPRFGRLLLVGLLILAIAALAIFAVGSRQQRLPPPFGPAANGARLASIDGDIYQVDAVTNQRRPLVTGFAWDFAPSWSRDGSRFFFIRSGHPLSADAPDPLLRIAVADPDGSNMVEIAGSFRGLDWFDGSPDGRQVAFLSSDADGKSVINIVDVATGPSGHLTTLKLAPSAHIVSWRPPDGQELIFRGEGDRPELFAVHPDGSGLRRLTVRPATNVYDFGMPAVSPDGNLIAYTSRNDSGYDDQLNILDLVSRTERVIPKPAGEAQLPGVFSPDGRSIAFPRSRGEESSEIVVARSTGHPRAG